MPKLKKVFAGKSQTKRICGYRLIGYEEIQKGSQTITREIREPVFEGEGKFKGMKLPDSFLREFMVDEDKLPPGTSVVPALQATKRKQ